MTDTNTERYFTYHARVKRVGARVRQLAAINPVARQKELRKMAKAVRKANCAFCKKYPEQCQ